MSNNFKDITVTIIFDGAALNRDEKIGGNIQSIKKLTIGDKVVSFISRPAIRHYLFNTLVKAFPDDWKPAKITAQGQVAQFDILQDDIITSAELDAFGYMYTIGGQNSLTRKAPLGITKAISLLHYNQDMAFYANHDLVQRGNFDGLNLTPNPFQREEQSSLYKLSFTIDSKILGEDCWVVEKNPSFNNGNLIIMLSDKNEKIIYNVEQANNSQNHPTIYKIKKDNNDTAIATVTVENKGENICKVYLSLTDKEKKRRICQILTTVKNGIMAHSSGEDNTIVPLFMIAAPVKVPSPVFHSYIDLVWDNGNPKVIGIHDCINNLWVEDQKVFIQDCDRLPINKDSIKNNLFGKWEDFLQACGLENCNCE